jgi:hypothetical protein
MRLRRGAIILAAGGFLLTLAWRLMPAAAPPVYDGVCLADPYRLLGHSPAPLSASKTFPASPQFETSEVTTDDNASPSQYENPQQAQILMEMDTFNAPNTSVTVSITPVKLAVPLPHGQQLDGNVYRITAVSGARAMLEPASSQTPVTVVLRATASNPPKTMYVYSGGAWRPLKTFSAGCGDSFEAVSPVLGDFALLYAAGTSGGSSSGGGFPVAVVVGVLIVVVLAAGIGLFRLTAPGSRSR